MAAMMANLDSVVSSAAEAMGIVELKEEQKKAVCSFVCGEDVFVSLPTGYGKSICFGLLPLVFDRIREASGSIVICISPLTALMMEQRTKFSMRGLATEFCNRVVFHNGSCTCLTNVARRHCQKRMYHTCFRGRTACCCSESIESAIQLPF